MPPSITAQAPSPMFEPIRGARSARMTRAPLPARQRAQSRRQLGRGLDPGQPAADHQRGEPAGRGGSGRQRVEMRRQPRGRVIGIDVETVLGQPRDRRPHKFAAEREDQPVVAKRQRPPVAVAGDLAAARNRSRQPSPLTRSTPIGPSTSSSGTRTSLRSALVIAHPDRVPRIAVDDRDRDLAPWRCSARQLADGADGGDQSGKPGSEHDDAFHHHLRRAIPG